ncbi:MAG: ZIP family metal transporter [Bacteroidales bacterium]|nr:ZIP family metal transporter [Candidatus Physcousia equi]
MTQVWISAGGLCGATLIGSVLGFLIKELPHKWNDTILGYCAGIMLAASTLGLIVPAFEAPSPLFHSAAWLPCAMVVVSVMVGAFFLNVLDLVTPHLHHITGLEAERHRNNASINHVLLFVMAIALHKLPEGMAAGVSLHEAGDASWTVSFGIALQNVPEGMVIIAPLLLAGVKPLRTFLISLAIGLLEVVGIWLGFGLGNVSEALLPIMLGFAGGAMLYVTSDEMIPETHAHGYQKQATYALLLGFMTLLCMERAFA